jgi:hypothetical protein
MTQLRCVIAPCHVKGIVVRRLVTAAAAGLAFGGVLLLSVPAQAASNGYPTPGSGPCAGYHCSPSAYPSTAGPTSSTSPTASIPPTTAPTASAAPTAPSPTTSTGSTAVGGSTGRTLPVTGSPLGPLAALAALLLAAGTAALLHTRRRARRTG